MLPGGDGGIVPLLLAAPTAAVAAWSGITGFKMSMNPKTANGDAAAQQAKDAREARRLAVHADFHREGTPQPSELKPLVRGSTHPNH